MNFFVGVVVGLALSVAAFLGWQNYVAPIGDLTAAEARAVAAALAVGRGDLKAELREPILKKPDSIGWFVCGWVRFGGANATLGAQPFVGLLAVDGTFFPTKLPVSTNEINAVKDVCASRGLYL